MKRNIIKRVIELLRVRSDERVMAIVAGAYFLVLNVLNLCRYWNIFTPLSDNYHKLFVNNYRVSGFDPLTYEVVSNWDTAYNVYRHPLLAFMMYPVYLINQGLMWLTGMNWAIILVAIILTGSGLYSCLFLYRILREIVGLTVRQSFLLCTMFFSFGFVMLSTMVPDHFVMSMMMLLLALYIAGRKMKHGNVMSKTETMALFVLTAGISLNNGLKIFMAALIAAGKRFFRPKYIVVAVLLPALMMWGFARWEYQTYVLPKEKARHEKKMKKDREYTEQIRTHVIDSLKKANVPLVTKKDSQAITEAVNKERKQRAVAKYRKDHKQIWNRNTGKPLAKDGFLKWTDISTSRWDTVVENLFGEGILLHQKNLLGDVLRNRPVVVRYSNPLNYVVEGMTVLFFFIGIWFGRREKFLWLTMSFFLMDMLLHVGLGFGINEIYIMSPHYLFVIPICAGYALKKMNIEDCPLKSKRAVLSVMALMTLYCLAWNLFLVCKHLFF